MFVIYTNDIYLTILLLYGPHTIIDSSTPDVTCRTKTPSTRLGSGEFLFYGERSLFNPLPVRSVSLIFHVSEFLSSLYTIGSSSSSDSPMSQYSLIRSSRTPLTVVSPGVFGPEVPVPVYPSSLNLK